MVRAIVFAVTLSIVGLFSFPPTAQAVAAPAWSGLDARTYAGPIPPAGTLMHTTQLSRPLWVSGAGQADRYLYSTVNQHNSPAVATAAVFTPKTAPPEGGWPVVVWAHGTVGLGDDCTPSAQPRTARDDEYLTHWLDQGYAVVAPDYTGLGTPGLMSYLNTVATAHAVVDAVVAAHQLDLPLAGRWALIGQSQGGAAAVGTARYASEFSAGRGLDYRGVVATGTPANVQNVVTSAGPDMTLPPDLGPAANSYAAYILAALRDALDVQIDTALSDAGRQAATLAETLCKADLDVALAGERVPGFFTAPLASVPGLPAAVDAYLGIPTSGYDRPIFLGQGLQDRDVPAQFTLTFADALKANGQPVELHVYPDEDHSGTVLASVPDSTPFLARILAP
ncbi:alpha/beta hydrolase family protein [Mycolicibacterium sp. XJ1819]